MTSAPYDFASIPLPGTITNPHPLSLGFSTFFGYPKLPYIDSHEVDTLANGNSCYAQHLGTQRRAQRTRVAA
jgi:hypothetical protein